MAKATPVTVEVVGPERDRGYIRVHADDGVRIVCWSRAGVWQARGRDVTADRYDVERAIRVLAAAGLRGAP